MPFFPSITKHRLRCPSELLAFLQWSESSQGVTRGYMEANKTPSPHAIRVYYGSLSYLFLSLQAYWLDLDGGD